MGVNMILSITLVVTLFGTGVAHAGLAAATGLAAWVNAALLFRGLRKAGVYRPCPGWPALLRDSGLAALAMGAVLYWPASQSDFWLDQGVFGRAGSLAALILAGAAVYFFVLWLRGRRPRQFIEPAVPRG